MAARFNELAKKLNSNSSKAENYAIGSITLEDGTVIANNDALAVTSDSISGTVSIVNQDNKNMMSLPMLAIENASEFVVYGKNVIGLTKDTTPNSYLDNEVEIYNLLQAENIVVPFEESGKDHSVLLTFWNDKLTDTNCYEKRDYGLNLRDKTLYIKSTQDNDVAEIICWT